MAVPVLPEPERTIANETESSTVVTSTGAVTCFSSLPVAGATTRNRVAAALSDVVKLYPPSLVVLPSAALLQPSSNDSSLTGRAPSESTLPLIVNFSPTNGAELETVGTSSPPPQLLSVKLISATATVMETIRRIKGILFRRSVRVVTLIGDHPRVTAFRTGQRAIVCRSAEAPESPQTRSQDSCPFIQL